MRILAVSFAIAAVLFLVTGGTVLLIPLLFIPLGLLSLRRGPELMAGIRSRWTLHGGAS